MQIQKGIYSEVEKLKFKKNMANLAHMILESGRDSLVELHLMKEYTEELLSHLKKSINDFPEQELIDQTSPEFVEFMKGTSLDGLVDIYDLRKDFISRYPAFNHLSHIKFDRWVKLFTKTLSNNE